MTQETLMRPALSPGLLEKMHAYWRAANYLSVGQIYLQDIPLLEAPLKLADIKPRLLGHWGTTTGLNFLYVHLSRLIKENDLDMIYVSGPGHRGPGLVARRLARRLSADWADQHAKWLKVRDWRWTL
jgi:xylulose-5-phosphate/fructose-6-phosphate phosphoketolase